MANAPRGTGKAPKTNPAPAEVQAIWEQVKDRAARQLFHPDPAKRLAAVAALEKKHPGYEPRAALLIHAALAETSSAVRAAMLRLVAATGYFTAWRECVTLRERAEAFVDDHDPAVRAALARCFEIMPIPLRESDIGWIAALAEHPEAQTDEVYASLSAMVARALRQGVATEEALAVFARLMRHPAFGYRARGHVLSAGASRARLVPELLAYIASGGDDAVHYAGVVARCGATEHDARAVATLEALRDRQPRDAWVLDLLAGMLDRASLPARLARHAEAVDAALTGDAAHPVALEAVSWVPSWMIRYADRCAYAVMRHYEVGADDLRARWIEAAAAPMALALRERLRDLVSARSFFPWWDRVSPATAPADALAWIDRVLAESPAHQHLSFEHQSVAEACCALFVRVGSAPPGALVRLAALAERQAPHLLSAVVPTVRAMHALGAREADFAPVVAAYGRLAAANDLRAAKEPRWDPERAFSASLRATAKVLPALGSIDALRACWRDVEHLLGRTMAHDRAATLALLVPYRDHPDVRARFEAALGGPSAQESHAAAKGLGRWVE